MASASKKRTAVVIDAKGATRLPSPDPPPVPDTPTIAADETDNEGIDLELACDACGCLVRWRLGDDFPETCPRCDD
jgi:hypothetical protein